MLREATPDDLDGVIELAKPWLEESGENLNFCHENFISTYLSYIVSADFFFYVIEYDGAIVGLGVLSLKNVFFKEKLARLEWFYIHKSMRGTGAGLKLAEFMRDLSLKNGARIIIADTIFARHARVFRNLFNKIGFEMSGYTMIYRS